MRGSKMAAAQKRANCITPLCSWYAYGSREPLQL